MRTPEENAAQFVEILRNGGTLVAHPDTLAELDANLLVKLLVPVLIDCRRIPNRNVKRGQFFACALPALDEFLMPSLGTREPFPSVTFAGRYRYWRYPSLIGMTGA